MFDDIKKQIWSRPLDGIFSIGHVCGSSVINKTILNGRQSNNIHGGFIM